MATFLERLQEIFWGEESAGGNGMAPALRVEVECDQCGEMICTRIEKVYELQEQFAPPEDGENNHSSPASGYLLTKELLGTECPNLMRLTMHFDADKELTEHSVEGGKLVEVQDSD